MAITTTFTVNNKLSVTSTNHILVFLKPLKASQNYQYYAWQDLNPAQNGNQLFDYIIDLGVSVFDAGSPNPPGPNSPTYSINPGQLFQATNPNKQGPILSTTNINSGQVSSSQAGVLNDCTTPTTRLGLQWTNAGTLVVAVGAAANDIVNLGKIITLELEPTLYFMAADPTVIGTNFTLQDFSAMTPYKLEAGVTAVSVDWTRDSNGYGTDTFTFTPPSK